MNTIEKIAPVRKSVTVKATIEHAFRVFTDGIDTWWLRTHHIGKSPMKKVILEGRPGGRCYTEQIDETECNWGSVLVWEPPSRLVIAWQVTPDWQFDPDRIKASEVEVRFTDLRDGSTRVDLEHRCFERHGVGSAQMRDAVDQPGGWSGLIEAYSTAAETTVEA
jgi:uncharacterized protein YndB with AHSA1/START domain